MVSKIMMRYDMHSVGEIKMNVLFLICIILTMKYVEDEGSKKTHWYQ